MASEKWGTMRFDYCAELIRDTVHPSEVRGLPYIGLEHIAKEQLVLTGYGSADDVTSAKSRFKRGDILFGKLRPYFRKVVMAPFDGVCSTDIWVVRCKHGIDQRFLFYWMASNEFIEESTQGSEGTRMPRAQWEFVGRIKKRVPPLAEQQAIAHILGTLDDKIELNRRMNQTLEEMTRAIFKSWFVDFDPVLDNALAAGNPIPEEFRDRAAQRAEAAQSAASQGRPFGLPKSLATQFPNAFHDSDLGPIPKGWELSSIGQHFCLTMGQSPPGSTYNEVGEGLPFYQGRSDFGFRFPTRRVYCTSPTRFAEPNDTLVSVRAPVGDVNMASERCVIGRGVAAMRHNSGSRSFTYYSVHHLREYFDRFEAEGTVFGSINKNDFQGLPFIAPTADIASNFERFAGPLDDRIQTCARQSTALAALRDTLLPKLLSGELRVRDAEKFVEAGV